MSDSLKLGRIAGIPIGANWSVLFVAVAVTLLLSMQILPSLHPEASLLARLFVAAIGAILFFASLLGHELGHALVARRHGVDVAGITLWLLGGVAKLMRQAPTPRAEFQIAIAGPAMSLLIGVGLGGASVGLARLSDFVLAPLVLAWLAAVNLLLAVSNLLPGAPLDGGRVLTAILWKRLGDAERARLLSARCGLILGALLMLAGAVQALRFGQPSGWWTTIVGMFVVTAARSEVLGAALRRRFATTGIDALMRAHPPTIPDSFTFEQFRLAGGPDAAVVGYPVVRWSTTPVGYLAAPMADGLTRPEQCWTTVAALMCPVDQVQRAWSTEQVADLMERNHGDVPLITVVHDPVSGRPTGTVTRSQVEPLFETPDFWGRDRTSPSDLVLARARH